MCERSFSSLGSVFRDTMGRVILRVFLAVVLWCSCWTYVIDEDESNLIMRTLIEGFNTIMEKLEDQEDRLATLDELQSKLLLIEEQLRECKQCAKRDDLEFFQNISHKELQEIEDSLGQCSTTDQISAFQETLRIDECEEGLHVCSVFATCSDKLIKYQCTCLPGYSGDGFECYDVNECLEETHSCGPIERCSNRAGTYHCVCQEGYEKKGTECIDTTTCKSPSLYLTGLGCITPVFTRMTWEESKASCEEMGKRLLEDIRKEHIEPLGQHFWPLMQENPQPWIGLKDSNWISVRNGVPGDVWAEATPDGGCGCFDVRSSKLGVWDGGCDFQDYALCQSI